MSHLYSLESSRQKCQDTNDCREYNQLATTESEHLEQWRSNRVHSTAVASLVIVVFILLLAVMPFSSRLKKMLAAISGYVYVALPVLIMLVIGVGIGFGVSFSACYKQDCSALANYSGIYIPLISVLISIPIAINFSRRRLLVQQRMNNMNNYRWLTALVILTVVVGLIRLSQINDINKYAETQQSQFKSHNLGQ